MQHGFVMSGVNRELSDYYRRFGDHLRPYLIRFEGMDSSEERLGRIVTENASVSSKESFEDQIYDIPADSLKDASPESSMTSRKLEWDSMADIGYGNAQQGEKQSPDRPLSTLERIALERHYKITFSVNAEAKNKATIGIKTKNPGLVRTGPIVADKSPEAEKSEPPIVVDVPSDKITQTIVENTSVSSQTQNLAHEVLEKPPLKLKLPGIMKHSFKRTIKTKELQDLLSNISRISTVSKSSSVLSKNDFKCDEEAVSRADSFEFVPGHLIDKPASPELIASSTFKDESSRSCISQKEDDKSDEVRSSVALIRDLVDMNHSDPELREKLYQRISKILLNASSSTNTKRDSPVSKIDNECQTTFRDLTPSVATVAEINLPTPRANSDVKSSESKHSESKSSEEIPPLNLRADSDPSSEILNTYSHSKRSNRIKTAVQTHPDLEKTSSEMSGPSTLKSHSCADLNSYDHSDTSKDTSRQIENVRRAVSTYQKCKSMQLFMRDYESLVAKYRRMKEAKFSKRTSLIDRSCQYQPVSTQITPSESVQPVKSSSASRSPKKQPAAEPSFDIVTAIKGIESRLAQIDISRKGCGCKSKPEPTTDAPSESSPERSRRKPKKLAPKPAKTEKPIAYNLLLQSSESILEQSAMKPYNHLEKIVVKVPKTKNVPRTLPSISDRSTDNQIKDFSSLEESVGEPTVANDLTLREHLENKRPQFVRNMNERQMLIKEFVKSRHHRDAELQKRIGPNLESMSAAEIRKLLNLNLMWYPSQNKRLFNSDIVETSRRQYRRLPEIRKKREISRQNELKRNNKLMEKVFAKHLHRMALKGVVNFPHHSPVISL